MCTRARVCVCVYLRVLKKTDDRRRKYSQARSQTQQGKRAKRRRANARYISERFGGGERTCISGLGVLCERSEGRNFRTSNTTKGKVRKSERREIGVQVEEGLETRKCAEENQIGNKDMTKEEGRSLWDV